MNDSQTAELKLELFPTTRIANINSEVTVLCEPVTPGIAITPYLDLGDGAYRLGGGFTITHTPTGRCFAAGQACIECARAAARALAAIPVDWNAIDPTSAESVHASLGEHRSAPSKALRLFGRCAQQVCFHNDEPCDACGMEMQHASYCIYVVGPMVAELNAKAAEAVTAR